MNMLPFTFAGNDLCALSSGALWWPEARRLLVADLHLGKSERLARRGGALLPPYEVAETLTRLEDDIATTNPREVICLGDSFDDNACVAAMCEADRTKLAALQSTKTWIWITGNHDPSVGLDEPISELKAGDLLLRHIADADPLPDGIAGEVSGHFHPKHHVPTRGGRVARRCFLLTKTRLILPAYGAYTGGLPISDPAFAPYLDGDCRAILVGGKPISIPIETKAAAH